MLDDIIAAATVDETQVQGRRVALIVRRVARAVAVPALLLMLGGLLLSGVSSGDLSGHGGAGLPGPRAGNLARLADPTDRFSGEIAMSLGLLALALTPAITVSWITVFFLHGRRWREAAVAATVVAILALSAILGKK